MGSLKDMGDFSKGGCCVPLLVVLVSVLAVAVRCVG
jgi:hypothetical protein